MTKKRKLKRKLSFHPVVLFIILILVTMIFSGILSLFNFSYSYKGMNALGTEYLITTESVNSMLNIEGLKYIFSNTVSNFANFTVLVHLIIILIGIGIMDYAGFLKTAVGLLTKKAKKFHVTYVIVLLCLLASIMDNLPFLAFIPLSALVFKYGKRNPLIGVIASFASLTCGYGISLFLTSIDSSLAKISSASASILGVHSSFGSCSMILIMLVAILILSYAITYLTENYIVRKIPKYEFEETEILSDEPLNKHQLKGLVLSGIGCLTYLIIFLYNIIPGLPLSGKLLNSSAGLYIDKLFGNNTFFTNGFVFIITMLFIIAGLLYGIGAKTIKNNEEFVESLGYSLNNIGNVLVLIFICSTFISIFKQTNIGNVITAGLTNLISELNFSGLPLVILTFICSAVATLFVPSPLLKWNIMGSQIVASFVNVGLSAEFAQVVFRFGESAFLCLTPVFAYYIIYLAYLEKYNQTGKATKIVTSLRYMVPYAILTFFILLSILVIWYLISLPLGIGGFVAV